jgi:CrcB protein
VVEIGPQVRDTLIKTLWVGLGGAIGSMGRYYLDGLVQTLTGAAFPFGTLAVNAIGSFLISVLMYIGLETDLIAPTTRIALTTGVLGGFTTYSTFNLETLRMMQDGAWTVALLNVGVTVLGCLVAGMLGLVAAKALVGS